MARGTIHETGLPGLTRTLRTALALGLFALCWIGMASAVGAGEVELVSQVHPRLFSDTGAGGSIPEALSADGRYFVFLSNAPNLVPGQIDRNLGSDLFLYDRLTGTTELVSRSAGSPTTAGNASSSSPALSADGRYVTFISAATDLVPGQDDSNGAHDVFLYDRVTQTTELVSHARSSRTVATRGFSWTPAISADGRFVAFPSTATDMAGDPQALGLVNVFLFDRSSGNIELVGRSTPPGTVAAFSDFDRPSLSADGRYVAFTSQVPDLVPGQRDTNRGRDVFLYDRISRKIVLVSHASSSSSTAGNVACDDEPQISSDGAFVAYQCFATNLVAGQRGRAGLRNLFLFQRATGRTSLVSHASSSLTTAADDHASGFLLSDNGGWVAFTSNARNLVARQRDQSTNTPDVFLYERASGKITLVSRSLSSPTTVANSSSLLAGLSADGNHLLFTSVATDLVRGVIDANGDRDVFLYDRRSGKSSLVSHRDTSATITGNGSSEASLFGPTLSADGKWVAFFSRGTDLESGVKDLNETLDVFLASATTGPELVSRRAPDLPAETSPTGTSQGNAISADGRFVLFTSDAAQLIPGQRDRNGGEDVFLRDRALGTTVLVSRAAGSNAPSRDRWSFGLAISANGNVVLYSSFTLDDSKEGSGLYLYDQSTAQTELLPTGSDSPGASRSALSADGSLIAFVSEASDLIPGQVDNNGGPMFSCTTGPPERRR